MTWLDDAFAPPPPRPPGPTTTPSTDGVNRWAAKALQAEVDTLAATLEGSRNDQLNTAAYNLGQIIAGGSLDEDIVRDALRTTARGIGLDDDEITGTLNSGISGGMEHPRYPKNEPIAVPVVATFVDVNGDPVTEDDLHAHVFEHLPVLDWQALWDDTDVEEWIIEPLLPARRLVAIYSAPKVGKSLLLLEMAVAVATGRPVLGTTPDRARRVLYVDFENDPKADIRERLQAMGHGPGDLANLKYLSFPHLAALDSEKGSEQLMAALAAYECEVVVIDTVSRAISGDENENDTWLAFYRHTGLKLKRAGIALVRLDHSGKDEQRGQRGASAKSGDVDAVWRMSKISETAYRLDCEAQRMPISEKTLVLHREPLPHLHHRVDSEGRKAAWDIQVEVIIHALDELKVPDDHGRDKCAETLRGTGMTARNAVLSAAVKVRKMRLKPVPEWRGQVETEYLSPSDGDSQGTGGPA